MSICIHMCTKNATTSLAQGEKIKLRPEHGEGRHTHLRFGDHFIIPRISAALLFLRQKKIVSTHPCPAAAFRADPRRKGVERLQRSCVGDPNSHCPRSDPMTPALGHPPHPPGMEQDPQSPKNGAIRRHFQSGRVQTGWSDIKFGLNGVG